ncbi:Zn-dependent protease with chaperone function [Devosia sp. UYZn731]|uniref:M48 family metallopeptidase n=1 Tax=Devosia sp. UYZn731 TaxID=3156345 RepID=UPI00339AB008
MSVSARYQDGLVAEVIDVALDYESVGSGGNLLLRDPQTNAILTRWAAADIHPAHGRKGELRLSSVRENSGARIIVTGPAEIGQVRAMLPDLTTKQAMEFSKQVRIGVIATVALATVILAYLYGVPLLAARVVDYVPPDWERTMGDTVATQMEASLKETDNFAICDPDPNSLANAAIARFGAAALGTGSPFTLDIKVVRTDVANAFALPGGKVYFFSALLDRAKSPDEFAGVLAHEIGHVVHRHAMEGLISSAGTGALVGFILGDMTGISIAAGLGSTMIDTHFSREAESQADAYAAEVASRMDFQPAGLADLLNRVAEDDDFSKALALFSTHPLTEDRRAHLEALTRQTPAGLEPPFTPTEWSAIKSMCSEPLKASAPKNKLGN